MLRTRNRKTARSKLSTMMDKDILEEIREVARDEGRSLPETLDDACAHYIKKSCIPNAYQNPLGFTSQLVGKTVRQHPIKTVAGAFLAWLYMHKKEKEVALPITPEESPFFMLMDQIQPILSVLLAFVSPFSLALKEIGTRVIPILV